MSKRLFLLAEKVFSLQCLHILYGHFVASAFLISNQMPSQGIPQNGLLRHKCGSNYRLNDPDNRAYERTWRIIFASVAARIAHILYFVFVQGRKLMPFLLETPASFQISLSILFCSNIIYLFPQYFNNRELTLQQSFRRGQ